MLPYASSIFTVLAFLAVCFTFWRRSREEHYKEDQLFDGLLLSFLVGLVVGRAGYVVTHAEVFGLAVFKWLNVVSFPGISGYFGLIGGALYLKKFAQKNRLDPYEVLDFTVTACSAGAVFAWLGRFLEGVSIGLPTTMPWGVKFPTVLEPHHPVALYNAIFYIFLLMYLNWAEFHYRSFAWYKASKKTAQTGFLTSAFVIFASLFGLIMTWFLPQGNTLFGQNADQVFLTGSFVFGVLLLYLRSGRVLPFGHRTGS
jgi:prolipoprotein diacylglyceryltransferase